MIESLFILALGVTYIRSSILERKLQKEEDEKYEIKMKIFCYALRHKLLYNEVVNMVNNNEISINDLEKEDSF